MFFFIVKTLGLVTVRFVLNVSFDLSLANLFQYLKVNSFHVSFQSVELI